MITTTFEDDMDKVTELMQAIIRVDDIENGINSFTCINFRLVSIKEVENTVKRLRDVEVLANLYRQAENLYIDEINGRYTSWLIKGSQAKDIINSFAEFILTPNQYKEFIDELYQMGC